MIININTLEINEKKYDKNDFNNNLLKNIKDNDKNINKIIKKSSLSCSRVTCRDWKDEVNKNNSPDNVPMTVSNGILSY